MFNRPDRIGILRYAVLFVLLWIFLYGCFVKLPPLEAKPAGRSEGPRICPAPAWCPMWAGDARLEEFAQKSVRVDREALELVVRTLAAECPYEPPTGMKAVAWVIKTRMQNRNLTYEQVIKQPLQFSCWNAWVPPWIEQLRDEPRETLGASKYMQLRWIAIGVMSGELGNPFPGANLYYSHCLIDPPRWAYRAEYLGSVGCHSFYKSK